LRIFAERWWGPREETKFWPTPVGMGHFLVSLGRGACEWEWERGASFLPRQLGAIGFDPSAELVGVVKDAEPLRSVEGGRYLADAADHDGLFVRRDLEDNLSLRGLLLLKDDGNELLGRELVEVGENGHVRSPMLTAPCRVAMAHKSAPIVAKAWQRAIFFRMAAMQLAHTPDISHCVSYLPLLIAISFWARANLRHLRATPPNNPGLFDRTSVCASRSV
jgi:hypothetical protein